MVRPKTILITGASRGIGRETAKLFAQNGYNVLINYNRSKSAAEELYDSLKKGGLSADIFKADVSIRFEVDRMVKQCICKFGGIDVLVNNARIPKYPCLEIFLKKNGKMFYQ